MFYVLYNFCLILIAPFAITYHLYRSYTRKRPAALAERLGISLPENLHITRQPRIWVHAVSVGEVLAARPLLAALRIRYPEHALLLTTMTETGRSVAKTLPLDGVYYIPFDFWWAVQRFITAIHPSLVVIMETELWPNLNHALAKRSIPLVLANGRISDESLRGYRRLKWFFKYALSPFSVLCMQTEQDVQRICAIGAPPDRTVSAGNLKYDISFAPLPLDEKCRKRAYFGYNENCCIVVAGSTHAGEEEVVLHAFMADHAEHARLILVPRHPERVASVQELVRQAGLVPVLRSSLGGHAVTIAPREVLIVDTVGELMDFYRVSDIAIVGGSIVAHGGHNILEPISAGVTTIFGPNMENFREVSRLAIAYEAGMQVSKEELAEKIACLVHSPALRQNGSAGGEKLLVEQGGSVRNHIREIQTVYPGGTCNGY